MNDQVLDETKVQEIINYLKGGLFVAVLLGLGAGLYYFIQSQNEERSQQAYSALFQAEKIEEAATKEAEALKVDVTELILNTWPESKRKDLEEAYLKVSREHSGTVAAYTAKLRAARWNFLEKKYGDAVKLYKEALNEKAAKKQGIFKAMAYEGMGAALEAQSQSSEALKSYEEALTLKDNPLKPLAYFGKFRAQKSLGKKAQSLEALEQVIKEFPSSPYERRARVLKALEG